MDVLDICFCNLCEDFFAQLTCTFTLDTIELRVNSIQTMVNEWHEGYGYNRLISTIYGHINRQELVHVAKVEVSANDELLWLEPSRDENVLLV